MKFSNEDIGMGQCRDLNGMLGREVRHELPMFTQMDIGLSPITLAQEEHL